MFSVQTSTGWLPLTVIAPINSISGDSAAVIKAIKKQDEWLVNRVYSGVPADWTGRSQCIEVGPMSGVSNVIYWLQSRGIEPTETLVTKIFEAAKENDRVMTDEEINGIIKTLVG